MCARSHTSVKYALNWMGHRRSDILDMYITMYDDAAEAAIAQIQYTPPAATTTPIALARPQNVGAPPADAP